MATPAELKIKYLDELKAFEESKKRFSAIVGPAVKTSDAIARSWNVNFGAPATLAPYDALGRSTVLSVVDLSQWPTPEQIMEGVRDCKQKYAAMKAMWDLIPDDDRGGLEPPPPAK